MMAVAVHANDERMTYNHSGLPISSTSPFIRHDHDILPGVSSVGTHFPLINGHSFTPQPSPELQKPGFEKILESTEPANNGESAKSSAQWTMAKNKVRRRFRPFDMILPPELTLNAFIDRDGTLRLPSLESWKRYPQASFISIQRLASYRWGVVRNHQPGHFHAP